MRLSLLVLGAAAMLSAQAPTVDVSIVARTLHPGEVIVVTRASTQTIGAAHVRAFDRDWPAYAVDERTWRAIVGIDLDVAPGAHPLTIRVDSWAGTSRRPETLAVAAKSFPTRRLTVDPAFVDPPAEVQKRIGEEAAELTKLWQSSSPRPRWEGAFVRPVLHEANSAFGSRSVFNDQPRSPHGGADFLSPAGTPVQAPGGGLVLLARDLYYTGGTVVIDHGAGVISLFAHLSAIDVAVGADVRVGDVVGKVGATGRVTGAHLHWTVRASGARIDPLALLHVLGKLGT
jgi:murein DD-endopeptidase MepM/ murein hydrolase activator NlpD